MRCKRNFSNIWHHKELVFNYQSMIFFSGKNITLLYEAAQENIEEDMNFL